MKPTLALLPLLLLAPLSGLLHAAQPAQPAPIMPLWDAAQLTAACTNGLDRLAAQVIDLERLPLAQAATEPDHVFAAWNQLQITQEDIESPVHLLNNVSPDADVRQAAEACLLRYNTFGATLYQNEALYQRVAAAPVRDAIDARLKKDLQEAFEDTGATLPADKKARMKRIIEELEETRQAFSRQLRDNSTRLSFSSAEMQGLPADYLARARRDEAGNYLLGFDYPEYVPFMENAENAAARQRYQFAFTNRGGTQNLARLNQVVTLRREMAALFGMDSYARFATRRRMAGSPEAVHRFLDEVMGQVRELELRDLEELRQEKATHLNQPLASTRLERWDVAYYQERVKRLRYAVDQEELRRYFPSAAAIAWALKVSETLYGIHFQPATAPRWHEDVSYYTVHDAGSNALLGAIYLDPYPRTGKYGHAAAFRVRGSSRLDPTHPRLPVSVLVANFNRQGLDFGELETLMHEFGHVLHGVLSRTRYLAHAGTAVETDFVEAPSQMYEEWARSLASVQLISQFCKDCPPVDAALMKRLNIARNFARGLRYARQHLYASYDMALYGKTAHDAQTAQAPAQTLWQQMEAETPLGHVADTHFPGQFGHIVSHYGAGYYSYMWSEVLALDMLSRFGDTLMNPAVGQQLRRTVLERGGEASGAELTRAFLGREPSPQAFFAEIRGERR